MTRPRLGGCVCFQLLSRRARLQELRVLDVVGHLDYVAGRWRDECSCGVLVSGIALAVEVGGGMPAGGAGEGVGAR
jgi:hypothetical protein